MPMSSNDAPVLADERQSRIARARIRARERALGELAEALGVTEPDVPQGPELAAGARAAEAHPRGRARDRSDADRELDGRQNDEPRQQGGDRRGVPRAARDGDSVFLDSGTTVEVMPGSSPARSTCCVCRCSRTASAWRRAGRGAARSTACCSAASCAGSTVVVATSRWRTCAVDVRRGLPGVSGFSELGVSVGSLAEAALKAAVIERARRVVLPIDHQGRRDRLCPGQLLDPVDVSSWTRASRPCTTSARPSPEIELIDR